MTEQPRRVSAIDPGYLDTLCRASVKRRFMAVDPYVREAYLHRGVLRDVDWLTAHTFIALKPDAIAGRRARLILAAVTEMGLRPVTATILQFDPVTVREVWRYQFNAASEQRIAVVDHLLGAGPTVLVLLRDDTRTGPPASVRLTAAKGSAEPALGGPTDLRTRIGRVNGLFNFIHTADEPIDVARELMLFSYSIGTQWLHHGSDRIDDAVTRAEAAIPEHDLDLAASLGRLASGADGWASLARDYRAAHHVETWIDRMRTAPLPDGVGRWDVLAVVTTWMTCNEPGIVPVVATTPAQAWAEPRLVVA